MTLPNQNAFGVREFVNLLVALLRFYLRHKPAIDAALGGDLAAAMTELANASESIESINEPGPA